MDTKNKKSVDPSKFILLYSNLSIDERKRVVIVLDKEPISWNVAYTEIKNGTKLGLRIQQKIIELDIL